MLGGRERRVEGKYGRLGLGKCQYGRQSKAKHSRPVFRPVSNTPVGYSLQSHMSESALLVTSPADSQPAKESSQPMVKQAQGETTAGVSLKEPQGTQDPVSHVR